MGQWARDQTDNGDRCHWQLTVTGQALAYRAMRVCCVGRVRGNGASLVKLG